VEAMKDRTPYTTKKASKFLAYVLRHHPEKIGIQLDSAGWVDVNILLTALKNTGWLTFDRKQLDHVVETNNKKRFAYSDDGKMIRASQGHSVDVELKLEEKVPPDQLYHGTVSRFLASIYSQGLIKGQRQHVHLSADIETARQVGSRRGSPVVLTILAKEMFEDGFEFFLSANGVWLTDHVPSEYLREDL
jgi:putative RNA 2'-phosphotransferase